MAVGKLWEELDPEDDEAEGKLLGELLDELLLEGIGDDELLWELLVDGKPDDEELLWELLVDGKLDDEELLDEELLGDGMLGEELDEDEELLDEEGMDGMPELDDDCCWDDSQAASAVTIPTARSVCFSPEMPVLFMALPR